MDGPLDSKTDFTFTYQSNVKYTMFKLTVRIQGRMILCFPMRFLYSWLTTKQKFFSVRIYQMKRKVNEQVIKTKFSGCFTKPHSKFSSIKPILISERLFLWTVSRIPESLCLCQTAVWVRPCVNNWSNWSIKVNFVSFNVCFFTPYVCQ